MEGQGGTEDSWAGGWQLSLGQHRQGVLTCYRDAITSFDSLLRNFCSLKKVGTQGPFGLALNISGYLSPPE